MYSMKITRILYFLFQYLSIREFIYDKMAYYFLQDTFECFHFYIFVRLWGIDAFTEYDVRWQKDLSVVSQRKEEKRAQTTTGMAEKERSEESGNSEPRRRKNAARYWSIDTLLRRLRCLLESSRRKNTPENRSGKILVGVKETLRGSLQILGHHDHLAS